MDEYKLDRSIIPTVCNRELRTVCCPTRFLAESTTIADTVTSRKEDPVEPDLEETEPFIGSQIIKSKVNLIVNLAFYNSIILECIEFKNLMRKNETTQSFILGEPPVVKITEICNQNKDNIGIASEKEFPHIALIKLKGKARGQYRSEMKCVGSLISDRYVLTSTYCVSSDLNYQINVELGVININSIDLSMNSFKVIEVTIKYGITLLKLNRKVTFNEFIIPACLYPDKKASTEFLLTGWTGDWFECDPKLKKWHISNDLVEYSVWKQTIDEAAIINYRQVKI